MGRFGEGIDRGFGMFMNVQANKRAGAAEQRAQLTFEDKQELDDLKEKQRQARSMIIASGGDPSVVQKVYKDFFPDDFDVEFTENEAGNITLNQGRFSAVEGGDGEVFNPSGRSQTFKDRADLQAQALAVTGDTRLWYDAHTAARSLRDKKEAAGFTQGLRDTAAATLFGRQQELADKKQDRDLTAAELKFTRGIGTAATADKKKVALEAVRFKNNQFVRSLAPGMNQAQIDKLAAETGILESKLKNYDPIREIVGKFGAKLVEDNYGTPEERQRQVTELKKLLTKAKAKAEDVGSKGKPDPAANKGRIIKNDKTGTQYKSNGTEWVEVKAPPKKKAGLGVTFFDPKNIKPKTTIDSAVTKLVSDGMRPQQVEPFLKSHSSYTPAEKVQFRKLFTEAFKPFPDVQITPPPKYRNLKVR